MTEKDERIEVRDRVRESRITEGLRCTKIETETANSLLFYSCTYLIPRYLLSIYYVPIFILGMDVLGEWDRKVSAFMTPTFQGVEGVVHEQVNRVI